MTAKIKRVFPGGNTADGFFSYYDYIIEQQDAKHIFCIKGGPGVGKSSMMKNIGNEMLKLGYDVEFHHCSSDNNSIDGLVILDLKVAMVDGTAHTTKWQINILLIGYLLVTIFKRSAYFTRPHIVSILVL
ncbi:MAG: hypothetical protein N4A48_11780 [Tepidibacter sp.]|uniref:hypothetical protein n=1 Tax=Tepidibacter sp. TaxID=2529387 RepID=UPI0025E7A877|nr:hypothetical protein [Tepidibacter sp.]MCT4509409.1 hypothetical protein [Tepidibacter sp.]